MRRRSRAQADRVAPEHRAPVRGAAGRPGGAGAPAARGLRRHHEAIPDFLAEARKLDLEVRPVGGAEVEALLKEIYASPPEVVKLATELVREGP